MILNTCSSVSRNLNTAGINYRKRSDNGPHTWISKVVGLYPRYHKALSVFIRKIMDIWCTVLYLYHDRSISTSENIKIDRWIFLGDSSFPLRFLLKSQAWICGTKPAYVITFSSVRLMFLRIPHVRLVALAMQYFYSASMEGNGVMCYYDLNYSTSDFGVVWGRNVKNTDR